MLDAEGNTPVRADPHPRAIEPIHPKDLTPEEVKMYKDCMFSMFFKAGLPFAALMHALATYKSKSAVSEVQNQASTPKAPRFPVKRAFFFFSNMFFGTFFFAPICYGKLLEKHNLEKKKKVLDAPAPEKTQPTRPPDDYHYLVDITSNLNEAESTFTPEFSTSRILPTEEEPKKMTPGTTYEDLRKKHRSTYERVRPEPPPPERPKTFMDKPADVGPQTSEKEPPKIVRRNKYGDEIE